MLRPITQWITAVAAAALLLGSLGANASARSLSFNDWTMRATWASLEFGSPTATIRCRLTLEGSFHTRTIAKVRGSLIGALTRAIVVRPCTNGEAWADNGTEVEPLGTAPNRLPFHLTYEGFRGTLPAIDEVRLLLSRISFVMQSSFIGIGCRGRYGRAEDNIIAGAARNTATGELSTLAPDSTVNRLSLVEALVGGGACPTTGAFRGIGSVTVLSSGNRITVTLI